MPRDIVTSFSKEHWFGKLYAPFLVLALVSHTFSWGEYQINGSQQVYTGLESTKGWPSLYALIAALIFYFLSLGSLPILARNFKLISLLCLEVSVGLVTYHWVITLLGNQNPAQQLGIIVSFNWGFYLASNSLLFANICGFTRFPKLPSDYQHNPKAKSALGEDI